MSKYDAEKGAEEKMKDEELADVSSVINRKFVTSTDNIARIEIQGPGGINVYWKNKPTELDMQEFNTWCSDVLDASVTAIYAGKVSEGSNKVAKKEYEKWRKSCL